MKTKFLVLLPLLALLVSCNAPKSEVIHPIDEFVKMDIDFNENGHYKVGILQPVAHDALDEARNGFIKKLDTLGWSSGKNLTINFQNAAGEAALLSSYANALIKDCDLVLGIGTGAAQQIKSSQYNLGSKKPILFTAVTDPVDSKLVHQKDIPGGFVTGTSDEQPISTQIELIKEILPSAAKVGILYTQTEENSKVQAVQASKTIKENGMTPIIATCTGLVDLSAATNALVKKGVQAIYLPTDNNIASSISIVTSITDKEGILIICGEGNMVKRGGHVTLSVNYTKLGEKTAELADDILRGKKSPNQLKVLSTASSECTYEYSKVHLNNAGLSLNESLLKKYNWINIDL